MTAREIRIFFMAYAAGTLAQVVLHKPPSLVECIAYVALALTITFGLTELGKGAPRDRD